MRSLYRLCKLQQGKIKLWGLRENQPELDVLAWYQIWAPHRRITPDPKFVSTVAFPRVSTALLRPPQAPKNQQKSTKKQRKSPEKLPAFTPHTPCGSFHTVPFYSPSFFWRFTQIGRHPHQPSEVEYRGISTMSVPLPPHFMHKRCPTPPPPLFHVPQILSRAQPEIYCVCFSRAFLSYHYIYSFVGWLLVKFENGARFY